MFKTAKALAAIGCLFFIHTSAQADTLSGDLSFEKRAPKAGVFYEAKTSFDAVNAHINQENKKFTEMIGVASHAGTLELQNNDQLEHNIFANDIKQDVKFDIGLMAPGSKQEITADWKTNTLVRIGCKIHPKMRSYVANIPSDNFVLFEFAKGQQGTQFELQNVADTSDKFTLLLAGMDKIDIKLAKGETKTVDILKKGKKKGLLTIKRT
jgi:hypothetical protein